MKLATWNINGIVKRLDNLRAWLAEAEPDVLCLQELKCTQADFPEAALEDAGYSAVWVAEGRWNGVAILARGRRPILTQTDLPGDPDDRQARYVEAAVGGLVVGCAYVRTAARCRGRGTTTSWPGWSVCSGTLAAFWTRTCRTR